MLLLHFETVTFYCHHDFKKNCKFSMFEDYDTILSTDF